MASTAPRILALDIATRCGWAYGQAGETPISGSHRFAKPGASRGAVFAGANRFFVEFLPDHPADILVSESPMMGGKNNTGTSEVLIGLPAVIEGMCYEFAVYKQERVARSTVLKHFVGYGSLASEVGKQRCMEVCRARGWIGNDDDDQSFDRSDALAVWSFAEFTFAPKLSKPFFGLFKGEVPRQ
jgi:hypothetical protein